MISLASAAATEFHLKDGEVLQGEVISANANALAIAPERAAFKMRLVPRSDITKILIQTERSGSIEGRLHGWEDGVYVVARGQDLVRIQDGRVVAVTSNTAAVGGPTTHPTDSEVGRANTRPADDHGREQTGKTSFDDAGTSGTRLTIDVVATSAREGDARLPIKVTLSRSAERPVVLLFSTLDATAIAGEDYVQAAGVITLPAGQTAIEYEIALVDDDLVEDEEMFELFISVDPNTVDLRSSYVTATIWDDD